MSSEALILRRLPSSFFSLVSPFFFCVFSSASHCKQIFFVSSLYNDHIIYKYTCHNHVRVGHVYPSDKYPNQIQWGTQRGRGEGGARRELINIVFVLCGRDPLPPSAIAKCITKFGSCSFHSPIHRKKTSLPSLFPRQIKLLPIPSKSD